MSDPWWVWPELTGTFRLTTEPVFERVDLYLASALLASTVDVDLARTRVEAHTEEFGWWWSRRLFQQAVGWLVVEERLDLQRRLDWAIDRRLVVGQSWHSWRCAWGRGVP